MSVLRSCYVTTGRLYEGGPPVRIRWYFTEPDAPVYDQLSCWEPELYRDQELHQVEGAGEVPGAVRTWYNGANPGVPLKPTWCGTEKDFQGEGTPPYLPDGRPDFAAMCSCAVPACIGFGTGAGFVSIRRAELAFEGIWDLVNEGPEAVEAELALEAVGVATTGDAAPGTGDLVYEGDGESSFNGQLEAAGDLVYHAEWRDVSGLGSCRPGDLVFEAETFEGEPPDGAFTGELVFEGEWNDEFNGVTDGIGEVIFENDIPDLGPAGNGGGVLFP